MNLVKAMVLSICFIEMPAWAQSLDQNHPLFEVGVGAAVFHIPDYPGADEYQLRTLGLPYGIYRGEFLRADDEGGLRGRFFNMSRWDLDLSFAAAFPANSERNEARAGMPDLDWIGRVGPRLIYRIFEKENRDSFNLNLPFQGTFSTDFSRLEGRGWVFQPNLDYDYNGIITGKLTLSASIGATFATRALMDYFYTVPSKYQKVDRAAYQAEGGLLELRYRLGAFWRISPNYICALSYGLNSYKGVTNFASPLLRAQNTQTLVFGFIWRLYSSKQRAFK